MSKFKSDKIVDGRPERERVEDFCGRFVESNNRMQAYRLAYSPDPKRSAQWIWDQVRALMSDPEVQQRIQQMRDEANQGDIVTFRGLLQDWADIASADPNELISIEIDCCRYCHGIEHAYQWIDDAEFARALASYVESEAKRERAMTGRDKDAYTPAAMPTDDGGYGYSPKNGPAFDCPHCWGRGQMSPIVRDTTKLTPQARKLYAGVKIGKDGQIEIKMHDQMKAREQLARVMGYFKDGQISGTGGMGQNSPPSSQGASLQDDPQQAYLKLIDSK